METSNVLVAERAEIDLICEQCNHEITIGEDYYYDEEAEEILCENCAGE